ncbi:uncharacterized protein LOC133176902 [Saccostrea echinata]|uniref:uncharacterized protein LOC133176902 n=1 Tax=Saccostrea echinata TaxID=191078 RepID=UPI002A81B9B9|nr:uncharacterized protein LOC133176902 [Saccostrea echinata]
MISVTRPMLDEERICLADKEMGRHDTKIAHEPKVIYQQCSSSFDDVVRRRRSKSPSPKRTTIPATSTTLRTAFKSTVTIPGTTAEITSNSAITKTAAIVTRTATTQTTSTPNDDTTTWKTVRNLTTESRTAMMNRVGQQDSTCLHVVLIPTLLGLGIIVTLVFCLVYKARVRNYMRHVLNMHWKNKTGIPNFATLNEEEEKSQNPYDTAAYSVVKNLVSPLPANMPSQQETVPQDECYSALDRRNERSETNTITCNNNNYDSLNQSNQPPMISNNVYSSMDPAFRGTEAVLSNTYGVYQ